MIDLESKFEVLEAEVKEINANKETLKRNLLDLIELQHILNKTQTFFMEVCTAHAYIHVCVCVCVCLVCMLHLWHCKDCVEITQYQYTLDSTVTMVKCAYV